MTSDQVVEMSITNNPTNERTNNEVKKIGQIGQTNE